MIVQVLKCILKAYLGQGGADFSEKSDLKIRTIEAQLDLSGSYKKKKRVLLIAIIWENLTIKIELSIKIIVYTIAR